MSDMKTIMEHWRAQQLSEGPQTVGDLISVIQQVKRAKAAGKGGKALVKLATAGLGDWVDFIDAAVDAGGIDLAKSLYGGDLSDKKQPAGLQSIAVDPDVSRIVADDIEKAFLSHLSKELEGMPPNTPINNVDTTVMLQDFIASKFNNKTVKDS
jgi:hypothetical protein